MKTKGLIKKAFLSVLIIEIVFISGCAQNPEEEQRQLQTQFPIVVERCGNLTEWELAGCVAKVANDQNDWEQCLSLPMMGMGPGVCECVAQVALKTGNLSLCEKCSMPKEKGYCRALVTDDWTECQKIVCDFTCSLESEQTQKDLCTQWIAIIKQNTTVCGQILNEQYRNQCLEIVEKR